MAHLFDIGRYTWTVLIVSLISQLDEPGFITGSLSFNSWIYNKFFMISLASPQQQEAYGEELLKH